MPKMPHKSSVFGALVSALKFDRKKNQSERSPPAEKAQVQLQSVSSPLMSTSEALAAASTSRRRSLENPRGSSSAIEVTLSELPRLDEYLNNGKVPSVPQQQSEPRSRPKDDLDHRSLREALRGIMNRLEKIERAVVVQSADEETLTNSMRLQLKNLEEENRKLKEMLSSVYTGTHDGAGSSHYSRNSSMCSRFILHGNAGDTSDGMYHHHCSSVGGDTPRILPLMVALGSQAGPSHDGAM